MGKWLSSAVGSEDPVSARSVEWMAPVLAVARSSLFRWTFAALIVVDGVLAGLHLWNALTRHEHPDTLIARPFFNLGTDRGLGEIFDYGELAFCVGCAWRLFRMSGSRIYAATSLLYALALVDDSLGIHEFVGHHIAFITANHRLGELLTLSVAGGFAMVLLLSAFRKTKAPDKAFGLALLALFGLLALFAGLLDSLHVYVVIEETAELAAISLSCAFLVALDAHVRKRSDAQMLTEGRSAN